MEITENEWEIELPTLIKNEEIPSISDQNNSIHFIRDYANKRIIISDCVFSALLRSKQIVDIYEYFRMTGTINRITLMIGSEPSHLRLAELPLKGNPCYFIGMEYDDETEGAYIDDKEIHYTSKALNEMIKAGKISDETTKANGRLMHYRFITNPKGQNYLPLFASADELFTIFPPGMCRI